MRIYVTRMVFAGETGERVIRPGEYDADDPRLQGCVRYLLDHRLAIIMEPDIFNNDPDVIEIVPDGRADVALPIEEMEAKTMPIAARDKKRKS